MSAPLERRDFLKSAGLGAAALAVAAAGSSRAETGAAEPRKILVGVIGTGGMGGNHVRTLAQRADAEIVALCDVDTNRLAENAQHVASATRKAPQTFKDMRQLLDRPEIEAVFIATPDHWHTPAALLALDAGKHVYVEKPCCHNIREGRLLVEAATRTRKIVQVGTQSRSTAAVREGLQHVFDGAIGDVLVAKAWNSQLRRSIGKSAPADPPPHLDYDLWLGPAPEVPYRPNMLPGIWRWWYDFGCGDIGNDGVHDIDVAVWGLGVDTHPVSAACLGGKYFFDDDQQFPDTQYAVMEYAPNALGQRKQFIFEQRIWSPYVQEGYENGIALYGTKGILLMGHTVGWKLYGPRMKLLAEGAGQADLVAHHTNFFDSIRGTAQPNAPATAGHLSATIVHLANIAARTRAVLEFDPVSERITNSSEADALVARQYREGHWAVPRGV